MSDGAAHPPLGWHKELDSSRLLGPFSLRQWARRAVLLFVALLTLYLAATAVRVVARRYYIFLPDYVRWSMTPAPATTGPTDVFLVFVDHFEPDYSSEAVARWSDRYRQLASRHHDHDGRVPQHTWFYPGEQSDPEIMAELQSLMRGGFGEVEMHLHHKWDNADTLRTSLKSAIAEFQTYGFLRTTDGATHFGFIHGNSSLDNSSGDRLCGVDEELKLLRELGCFADFTFPSLYRWSQPESVNNIYAARDDPSPKSYRTPRPLSDLRSGRADLMIFQGPLVFSPSWSVRRLFLDLDDGNVHAAIPPSPARADQWIRADVHVPERPEWRFIKLFAHSLQTPGDEDAALGPSFDETLTYLEREYNDGRSYVLHYVTAREAYNLAMAASAGVKGDPRDYYDYVIPRYVASAKR